MIELTSTTDYYGNNIPKNFGKKGKIISKYGDMITVKNENNNTITVNEKDIKEIQKEVAKND